MFSPRYTYVLTGLRARAIVFIQLLQPLRVSTKSNKYGGGKAPKQTHMVKIWQRLMTMARSMEDDPQFLFDLDFFVFDDVSATISQSCRHYRETKSNSPMVEKLFSVHEDTYDHTVTLLKSYGSAMFGRLTKSQGGAVEFLEGGKCFNATGALADLMKIVDATSDCIESLFGIDASGVLLTTVYRHLHTYHHPHPPPSPLSGMHDLVGETMSKNTSFHVTSTLATWKYNSTTDWLRSLSSVKLEKLMRGAVKKGVSLKRETDFAISSAAADKLKRLKQDAKAKCKSDKKILHDILELRSKKLFKTVDQYEAFCSSVNHDVKKIVKELKMQIRILNKVCVHVLSMLLYPCSFDDQYSHIGVWYSTQKFNDIHPHG